MGCQNFVWIDFRKVLQNITPIEIRNRHTESAVCEFCIEVFSPEQQIGAVKRHAESHVQQSSGHHGDPGPEEAVVYVDVVRRMFLKPHCEARSQKRMDKGLGTLEKTFAAAKQYARHQWRDLRPMPSAEPQSL